MPNPYFQFKQFTIYQDRCAMKVGTDGVLLGAWAPCAQAQRILDVGAGTGLVSLMMAQRSSAQIDAVELDAATAEQAKENVSSSPFKERIRVYASSFQDYVSSCQVRYDLIVSNPPFFHNSLKPPKDARSAARHTDSLPFEDLILGAMSLLTDGGQLVLILPITEGELFISRAQTLGLYCIHKTEVYPKPKIPAKRLLLILSKQASACVNSELTIETEHRHQYSDEFKALTTDFYLEK